MKSASGRRPEGKIEPKVCRGLEMPGQSRLNGPVIREKARGLKPALTLFTPALTILAPKLTGAQQWARASARAL